MASARIAATNKLSHRLSTLPVADFAVRSNVKCPAQPARRGGRSPSEFRREPIFFPGEDATPFFPPSGIPRYSVDVCDWYYMPLEPCPACGYALSVLDHHCRHCPVPLRAFPSSRLFDAKHLSKMIIAVVVLSVLVYLIFFR